MTSNSSFLQMLSKAQSVVHKSRVILGKEEENNSSTIHPTTHQPSHIAEEKKFLSPQRNRVVAAPTTITTPEIQMSREEYTRSPSPPPVPIHPPPPPTLAVSPQRGGTANVVVAQSRSRSASPRFPQQPQPLPQQQVSSSPRRSHTPTFDIYTLSKELRDAKARIAELEFELTKSRKETAEVKATLVIVKSENVRMKQTIQRAAHTNKNDILPPPSNDNNIMIQQQHQYLKRAERKKSPSISSTRSSPAMKGGNMNMMLETTSSSAAATRSSSTIMTLKPTRTVFVSSLGAVPPTPGVIHGIDELRLCLILTSLCVGQRATIWNTTLDTIYRVRCEDRVFEVPPFGHVACGIRYDAQRLAPDVSFVILGHVGISDTLNHVARARASYSPCVLPPTIGTAKELVRKTQHSIDGIFVDPFFPPCARSLSEGPQSSAVPWYHLSQLHMHTQTSTVYDEIAAVLSTITKDLALATVWVCMGGWVHPIDVDYLIPDGFQVGSPTATLIRKAHAKAYGSYRAVSGLTDEEVIADLTSVTNTAQIRVATQLGVNGMSALRVKVQLKEAADVMIGVHQADPRGPCEPGDVDSCLANVKFYVVTEQQGNSMEIVMEEQNATPLPCRSLLKQLHLPMRKKPYYLYCVAQEKVYIEKNIVFSLSTQNPGVMDISFVDGNNGDSCVALYQLIQQKRVTNMNGHKVMWGATTSNIPAETSTTTQSQPSQVMDDVMFLTPRCCIVLNRIDFPDSVPTSWYLELSGVGMMHKGIMHGVGDAVELPCEEEIIVRLRSVETLEVLGWQGVHIGRRAIHQVQLEPLLVVVELNIL